MKPQPIGRYTLTPSYEDLQAEIARLRDALDEQAGRAAWNYDCLTQCEERVIQRDAEIARLRLTDAEREAVEAAERCLVWQSAVEAEGEMRDDRPPHKSIERAQDAATLRGLLSRTGDCPEPDNAADRDSGTTGHQ